MSIEERRYERYSIILPAFRFAANGERKDVLLKQISILGCFLEWDESLAIGDTFRLELILPNNNYLPVMCQTIYRLPDMGLGVKFLNISHFEQTLVAQMIVHEHEKNKLSFKNPFNFPDTEIEEEMSKSQEEQNLA